MALPACSVVFFTSTPASAAHLYFDLSPPVDLTCVIWPDLCKLWAMIQRIANLMFCLLVGTAATCQPEAFTRVEFTTGTRGYQKQVFITSDSVIQIVNGRQDENKIIKHATAPTDWKLLVESLKDIKLETIPALPSPTSRRTFDGARYSRIKVTTKDGKEYEHSFDDEVPHADLKPLMDAILNIQSPELQR